MQQEEKKFQNKFIGTSDEIIVNGKVFYEGEWIPLEEYKHRLNEQGKQDHVSPLPRV
jgi:hypothetical protein